MPANKGKSNKGINVRNKTYLRNRLRKPLKIKPQQSSRNKVSQPITAKQTADKK